MNSYERKCYERDGFIIIKGILPKDECRELVSQIKPLIRKERREASKDKDKDGMCIMGKNRIGQPIIGKYRKWTAIYENPRLQKVSNSGDKTTQYGEKTSEKGEKSKDLEYSDETWKELFGE